MISKEILEANEAQRQENIRQAKQGILLGKISLAIGIAALVTNIVLWIALIRLGI